MIFESMNPINPA